MAGIYFHAVYGLLGMGCLGCYLGSLLYPQMI